MSLQDRDHPKRLECHVRSSDSRSPATLLLGGFTLHFYNVPVHSPLRSDMTTNENENGWDSLADELGIEPPEPTSKPEQQPAGQPEPTRPAPIRPAPSRPTRDPRPEIEQEADDFGAGVSDELEPSAEAALYDPGDGIIAEDADEYEDVAVESFEDAEEGFEPPVGGTEGQEGGKRRRRRRRRKKKGSESAETPAESELAETDELVEEGEAPAEVEGDDEDESDAPAPAMEEELEEEVVRSRPEWHVMTWAELVSKLYRPS